MQLGSWRFKLQSEIMSHLDKRHSITFSRTIFSQPRSLTRTRAHARQHHFKRRSHGKQVFVSASFLPIRLQRPKHLCLGFMREVIKQHHHRNRWMKLCSLVLHSALWWFSACSTASFETVRKTFNHSFCLLPAPLRCKAWHKIARVH